MWAVPDCYHVVVHLLELLLGGVERVGGRVELIGFEALVGEPDLEGLFIFLPDCQLLPSCTTPIVELVSGLTSGRFSAWDEAASVVTARRAKGAKALRRTAGVNTLFLRALENIFAVG